VRSTRARRSRTLRIAPRLTITSCSILSLIALLHAPPPTIIMVFKLLQRFGSSAKRVDKDKDKDKDKRNSSNNDSTGNPSQKPLSSYSKKRTAAMAGIVSTPSPDVGVFVPSTAPRLDLSITRTPSPPLVDVPLEGYRTNSPWVDLAAEAQKPARPGSFGFGSGPRGGSSSPSAFGSSPPRTVVNDKLQTYLDEKRVTVEQATVLVRECSKVLQRQGEWESNVRMLDLTYFSS
jgi:hypothetical protein